MFVKPDDSRDYVRGANFSGRGSTVLTALSKIEGRPIGLYLSRVQFVQKVPIVQNILNGLIALNPIHEPAHFSGYALSEVLVGHELSG
jgi:hypothetical protein